MSLNDILLPKYISDSCYASLTQIYNDIFQSPSSKFYMPGKYKQKKPTEHAVLSLDRQMTLNQAVYLHKSD